MKAFFDSNKDGIGDFPGLTEKLDYIAGPRRHRLWLLPFYPSPMRMTDMTSRITTTINPLYGTLDDFETFVQRSARAWPAGHHRTGHQPHVGPASVVPGRAPRRRKARQARLLCLERHPEEVRRHAHHLHRYRSVELDMGPVAQRYYWHRFFTHQPDLNFDNPAVRKAISAPCDFWLDLGVDGLRLDAIPYLVEREGTTAKTCRRRTPSSNRFAPALDKRYGESMLLAEANQWPEDAVAYFGDGDECHMAFHFPLMPRLFMSMRMEDRLPIVEIMEQTPDIPPTASGRFSCAIMTS